MLSVLGDLVLEVEALASQRRYREVHRLLSSAAHSAVDSDPLLRFYMILSTLQLGDLTSAEKLCDNSVDQFERHQPSRLYYRYLNVAGIIATHRGRLGMAATSFMRVYDLASRVGDLQLAADASMNLGVVYDIQGDWDRALSSQSRALATFSTLGDFQMVAACQHNMGMTFRQLGLLESSRAAFEIAADLHSRHGGPDGLLSTLLERIVLSLHMEESAVAEVLLQSAAKDFAATRNNKLMAEELRVRGLVAAAVRNLDAAFEYFSQADHAAKELGILLLRAEATAGMAAIQRKRGDEAEASRLLDTAVGYYRQIGAERRAVASQEAPSYFG